jgi:hypothetical protein
LLLCLFFTAYSKKERHIIKETCLKTKKKCYILLIVVHFKTILNGSILNIIQCSSNYSLVQLTRYLNTPTSNQEHKKHSKKEQNLNIQGSK